MAEENGNLAPSLQDLDRRIGGWKTEPEKKPAAPTPDAEGKITSPSREEVGKSWYNYAGRGILKGAAGVAESGAKLLPYAISPLQGIAPELSDLIQQHPYYQNVKEFAEEPTETTSEAIGKVGGQVLGTSAIPGFGVEAGAAKVLAPTLGRLAPYGARLMGQSFKGALGGALAEPEAPGRAAAGGALAGLLPGVGRTALGSRMARQIGSTAVPIAASIALEKAAMHGLIPSGIAHGAAAGAGFHAMRHMIHSNIRWHSAPVGGALSRSGRWIMDKTGKRVGEIPAGVMGFFLGPEVGKGGEQALDYFGGFAQQVLQPNPNRPQSVLRTDQNNAQNPSPQNNQP